MRIVVVSLMLDLVPLLLVGIGPPNARLDRIRPAYRTETAFERAAGAIVRVAPNGPQTREAK